MTCVPITYTCICTCTMYIYMYFSTLYVRIHVNEGTCTCTCTAYVMYMCRLYLRVYRVRCVLLYVHNDIHQPLPRVYTYTWRICIYAAYIRNVRGSATLICLRISLQVHVVSVSVDLMPVVYPVHIHVHVHAISSSKCCLCSGCAMYTFS